MQYDCPDSHSNETKTVKENDVIFKNTSFRKPPFAAMSVETDSCVKEDNKCQHNLVKNKGVTVMGSHVKQNFKLERFPLQTRGQHTFIFNLVIGDPSENNIFMMDMDTKFYSPI